jgi:hypothetical protein
MGTKITVSTLVGTHLFPRIKCVCDPRVELIYNHNPKSICGVVFLEYSPPVNVTNEEWWEHAHKWIGQSVSILCSSKKMQMKWSFMI